MFVDKILTAAQSHSWRHLKFEERPQCLASTALSGGFCGPVDRLGTETYCERATKCAFCGQERGILCHIRERCRKARRGTKPAGKLIYEIKLCMNLLCGVAFIKNGKEGCLYNQLAAAKRKGYRRGPQCKMLDCLSKER